MQTNKASTYKRVVSYIIDILIISIVTSLITSFLPNNKEYDIKVKELAELTTSYTNKEIEQDEYIKKSNDINYDITSNSVDMTLITCALSLLYFVVYSYYTNGETLGKKIMKIRIVSANEKELHINNYLIRCLLVNSVLANTVTTAMIIFMSKSNYIKYYSKVSNAFTIVLLSCIILAIYRKDGRGLHDLVANTRVINKNIATTDEKKEEIVEATYKEIKDENDIKPKSKKTTKKDISKK